MFQRLASADAGGDMYGGAQGGGAAAAAAARAAAAPPLQECTAAHWLAQFGEGTALTATLDEPCCICLDEMRRSEAVLALRCGHLFHAHCVRAWLGRRQWCPLCKEPAL